LELPGLGFHRYRLGSNAMRFSAFSMSIIVALAVAGDDACRADHSAEVDRLVLPLVENDAIVGCVVGIIDGDQREVHGYGEIVRGGGQAPNGDTVYEIGSITKAYTGTLLADMVERGLVKLDDPISTLLPEGTTAPAFAADQPLTLLHLATHTSGLPRLPDNMPRKDPTNPYADYTPELMYSFLSAHKLRRAPGEYEYSNYGAGLLGALLARRANISYEQLVIDRIAAPLEMNDTRITLTPDEAGRLSPPYNRALDADKNWDLNAVVGAGGLRSTVNDQLKFLAAALADDDRPLVQALHFAGEHRHGEPGEIGVGLGWHVARDGVTRWHNGQTGGYSSFVGYFQPRRVAVAVLCNTATDLTTTLGEKILQSALGMEVESIALRKSVIVDASTLESYVGVYELAPTFAITITLEDGQLMAQATGQDKFPVFPESATEFFYKVVDAQLSFAASADGKIEKLILHQNGRDLPGTRVEASSQ
jgi:CubicO group peptidase (beta-lactamase class C family)